MFEKLKTLQLQRYIQDLRDVRVVGLMLFAGIMLLVAWSGIGVIQTNYDLQKKISTLQQTVNLRSLENSNLKLKNEYFETDQYLELQARKQFGKAAPGETLILVPRTVSLQNSIRELPTDSLEAEESTYTKPAYQQNFESWMDFLFRRQPLNS